MKFLIYLDKKQDSLILSSDKYKISIPKSKLHILDNIYLSLFPFVDFSFIYVYSQLELDSNIKYSFSISDKFLDYFISQIKLLIGNEYITENIN